MNDEDTLPGQVLSLPLHNSFPVLQNQLRTRNAALYCSMLVFTNSPATPSVFSSASSVRTVT
jgi:hypothetical protein